MASHRLTAAFQEFTNSQDCFSPRPAEERSCARKRSHGCSGQCLAETWSAETPERAGCLRGGSPVCRAALSCPAVAACGAWGAAGGAATAGAARLRVLRELRAGGLCHLGLVKRPGFEEVVPPSAHIWGRLLDPRHLLLVLIPGQTHASCRAQRLSSGPRRAPGAALCSGCVAGERQRTEPGGSRSQKPGRFPFAEPERETSPSPSWGSRQRC